MTTALTRIEGSCHCRNIVFDFWWPESEAKIPVRKCGCSFCVKRAGAWTSHRHARLVAEVNNSKSVTKYRFGTKTADFYVCATCGVVPFVLCEINDKSYAVVNVNALDHTEKLLFTSSAANFDGEEVGDRLERRKRKWIPDVQVSGVD